MDDFNIDEFMWGAESYLRHGYEAFDEFDYESFLIEDMWADTLDYIDSL